MADDLPDRLRLLEQMNPDVLLVDSRLPSVSGIDLISCAHEHLPICAVVVINAFGDEQRVLEYIEAGSTGYIHKERKAIDIVEQIRTLRAGGSPISPAIARQLMKRFMSKPYVAANLQCCVLSAQERTVLEMS